MRPAKKQYMESESRQVWRMRTQVLLVWGLAIVVTAFLGLVGYLLLSDMSWQKRPDLAAAAFGLGLALLGACTVLGLWFWALRVALASHRYGDAEFELARAPARLGERLKGRIRAQARLSADQAINLVFQCWGSRSGGGDSGGEEWLRWDSESLLTATDIEQSGDELILPVDLEIPASQLPTGEAEKRWDISWILIMKLEPSTGYKPAFDIVVESSGRTGVETGESVPPPHQSSLNIRNKIAATPGSAPQNGPSPTRPPHARVRVEPQPAGGVQFTPHQAITATFYAGWCLFTLPLWVIFPVWGLAELEGVVSPPIIAYVAQLGLAFGAAFLFNGLPVLGQAFVNNSFLLAPDGVSVKRLLRRKRFPAGHFTRCEAVGNSKDAWMVSLERSDTDFFGGLVVAIVTTEAEARWLVEELSRALDREVVSAR